MMCASNVMDSSNAYSSNNVFVKPGALAIDWCTLFLKIIIVWMSVWCVHRCVCISVCLSICMCICVSVCVSVCVLGVCDNAQNHISILTTKLSRLYKIFQYLFIITFMK